MLSLHNGEMPPWLYRDQLYMGTIMIVLRVWSFMSSTMCEPWHMKHFLSQTQVCSIFMTSLLPSTTNNIVVGETLCPNLIDKQTYK